MPHAREGFVRTGTGEGPCVCRAHGKAMRLVERLQAETDGFHPEADEDLFQLLGPVTRDDYHRFLTRTLGFVQPIERAIAATPNLERVTDVRRFEKHHLLRRDLVALRMRVVEIDKLPQCSVPAFGSVHEALGWAFVIERSTLVHGSVFRNLAM